MDNETTIPPPSLPAASETPSAPASGPTPAATDPQAGDAGPAPKDYARLAREDPDLAAHIKAEANRIAQLARNREAKLAARRLAREAQKDHAAGEEDSAYTKALQVADRVASEPDDEDEDDAGTANTRAFRERHAKAAPLLERLRSGDATKADYKAIFEKHGAATMTQAYRKDPEGFVSWMLNEIADHRATQKTRTATPEMAKAMATEQVNAALQNLPVPMSGGGGGGGVVSLERYLNDAELRAKLRNTPDGRKAIDEMMRRAQAQT